MDWRRRALCMILATTVPFGAIGADATAVEAARAAIRTKEYPRAVQALAAAQTNDAEAQYLLASLYRTGLGVPIDTQAARRLLIAAASAKQADAAYALADSYANEEPIDRAEARAWLERAAMQGHPLAQVVLKRGVLPREMQPRLDLRDPSARRAALWSAVREDDAAVVGELVDAAAIALPDAFGRRLVAHAVEHGATNALRVLLAHGADVSHADAYGTTPLMLAAAHAPFACVQLLLDAHADVAAVDQMGNTPLMYAAAREPAQPAIVERLMDANVSMARNVQGWSALDWALTVNDERVVRALRERGVSALGSARAATGAPSVPLRRAPIDLYRGWSDAEIAASRASNRLLQALQREQPSLALTPATLKLAIVAESDALPQLLTPRSGEAQMQETVSVWAIRHASPATLQMLIARGVIGKAAATAEPPLIVAIRARRPEIVKLLLDAHANVDAVDDEGRTALMIAATMRESDTVAELIEHLARVDAVDGLGRTALWYAAAVGDASSVSALLRAGSGVAHVDRLGQTALAVAAANAHADVIMLLLNAGANRSQRAAGASTPLMLAARGGDVDTIRALLQGDAALDAQNRYGDTALIVAARQGHADAVRMLIAAGASTKIRNTDRMSALDVASALGLTRIEQLLGGCSAGC